jgi:A/G-specific adenine glycosylase
MATRFHSPGVRVNGKTQEKFRRDLVHWYQRHQRKLPWRATRDPYRIWVSEIMLQQTRVDVVRDYYQRWLRAFPTVRSLANAPYSRVLKLWEGLGYYSRARNLHHAAKLVVRNHRGKLPTDVDELMGLPGIGRYTAGAIASIAFNQRAALVDGNVARVFARVFGIEGDVTKPATQKTLWEIAGKLLPQKEPGTFNQALMELGALICTPVNPRCDSCPMRLVCVARATGRQNELPNRGPRRTHLQIVHDTALVRRGNRFLLQRRPAKGLLAGMWELPALAGNGFRAGRQVLDLRHTITNKKIQLRVFECRLSSMHKPNGTIRWVSVEDLARLTLPAAQRRALEQILSAQ